MRVQVMWICPALAEAALEGLEADGDDEQSAASEEARTLMRLLRDLRDLRGYL